MSYQLAIEAAKARVKAALIDLLIVTSDGGINGEFDYADACAQVDAQGEVSGQYSVGRLMADGNPMPSAGGTL